MRFGSISELRRRVDDIGHTLTKGDCAVFIRKFISPIADIFEISVEQFFRRFSTTSVVCIVGCCWLPLCIGYGTFVCNPPIELVYAMFASS